MKRLIILTMVLINIFSEEIPVALREFKNGNLLFSAKTYKALAKGNNNNFLVSPLSVEVALALVEAGARGESAQQLRSGLNLPKTDETIQEAFKSIALNLNYADDLYTLTSANNIYIKHGYQINPTFKNIATSVYNAGFEEVDFTNIQTPIQINKWINEKTHGKIDNVVSSDDFDVDTRAVIVNALYFNGFWQNQFYVENTKQKPFHLNGNEEVKVKMMEQTDLFRFYKDDSLKAKFLELHYYGSPVTLTLVLPNDIEGLVELEKNIDKVLVSPEYHSANVHVQIPHIKIEQKIDFIPILKEFGITDIFNHKANLTGIAKSEEQLTINKVVQKTFITVDEKGTTAAAVTVAIAVADSALISLSPPEEFEANHPFIFILRSPEGILFIGRCVNPL